MYYLISTAGHPNLGDELITRTWLRLLAERAPDVDVWLDCPNPAGAQALLADAHPRLRCVDTLFRLCWEAPSEDAWEVASFVGRALDDHGQAPRWVPGLRRFGQATVVHLIGGGYVNGVWPRHLGLLAALDWAAKRGARTAVTGQGLAPLGDHTVALVRRLLRRVDTVDVRDCTSADLLGRPDALSGDDLWLAEIPTLVDAERASGLDAVVCVQGDLLDGPGCERLTEQCLAHLDRWGVDPARTAVLECIPRVDRGIFDRLAGLLPGLHFVPWFELLERGVPAAAHQRWFSTRFHPHLIASAVGARGVAVPVRPGYYDVKHGSLVDSGSAWHLLVPGSAGVAELETDAPGTLAVTGERVRARKLDIATGLYGPAAPAPAVPAPRPDRRLLLTGRTS
ncbi:polysaccharide pyruvyl transferase family protein [Geodermatophilus sp. SYSU D01062]